MLGKKCRYIFIVQKYIATEKILIKCFFLLVFMDFIRLKCNCMNISTKILNKGD